MRDVSNDPEISAIIDSSMQTQIQINVLSRSLLALGYSIPADPAAAISFESTYSAFVVRLFMLLLTVNYNILTIHEHPKHYRETTGWEGV